MPSRFLRMLLILTLVVPPFLLHAQPTVELWSTEPLIVRNAAIPDLPDRRILDIGEVWTLRDEIVLWARVATGTNPWALLSWKGGVLRTVLTDGEASTSKYAPGEKLHVHHDTHFHPATRILGGARMYLTMGTARASSVYEWTGERLQPVLREGDAIRLGGVSYTVASAVALQTSPDGDALLRVETSQPETAALLAAYVGSRVVPLVKEGVPVPGTNFGVSFAGGVWGGENIALLRGGNLVFAMSTGRRSTALVSVTAKGVTKLLATGDRVPEGTEIIERLGLLDAGADAYVANVNYEPYLCSGARCRRIVLPLPPGMEIGVLLRGGFVSTGSPRATFIVGTARRTTKEEREVNSRDTLKYRFDLLFFDGAKASFVTASTPIGVSPRSQLRAIPGARVMLFEDGRPADESAWRGQSLNTRAWELDVATGALGPLRTFRTDKQRTLSLRHVLAVRSPTEMVVRIEDGIHRLRPSAAGANVQGVTPR